MRIGSLFSGIGGLDAGLEWAGVGETVWQVERDKFCLQVLAHHWPHAQRFTDVRDVGAHNLSPVDVICGGFPCTDISPAGRGAGIALGNKSGLWYEFQRIVGELRPPWVVIENSSALDTRKHRPSLDAVLGGLRSLGYRGERARVSASELGAPQRRDRLFILAWLADATSERCGEARGLRCDEPPERISGSGEGVGNPTSGGRRAGAALAARRTDGGRAELGDAEGGRDGRGEGTRRLGRPGPMLAWADAVPVRGYDGTVRLIPREAADAGPESPLWPFSSGLPGRVARLRAIGNSVVPQVAEVVGRRLMAMRNEHHAPQRTAPRDSH